MGYLYRFVMGLRLEDTPYDQGLIGVETNPLCLRLPEKEGGCHMVVASHWCHVAVMWLSHGYLYQGLASVEPNTLCLRLPFRRWRHMGITRVSCDCHMGYLYWFDHDMLGVDMPNDQGLASVEPNPLCLRRPEKEGGCHMG